MNLLVLCLLLQTAVQVPAKSPELGDVVPVPPNRCEPGLLAAPSKNYQLFVFCDDAQGTQVGVIHTALPGADPNASAWALDRRFWQEGDWSLDVTTFAWLSDSQLLVITSPVYGTGALFHLELPTRKVRRLYPPGDLGGGNTSGLVLDLTAVDLKTRKATLTVGGKLSVVAF